MELEGIPEDHPLREVIEHAIKHQMDDEFWRSEFHRQLEDATKGCSEGAKAVGRLLVSQLFDDIDQDIRGRGVLPTTEIPQLAFYMAAELTIWAAMIQERAAAPTVDDPQGI